MQFIDLGLPSGLKWADHNLYEYCIDSYFKFDDTPFELLSTENYSDPTIKELGNKYRTPTAEDFMELQFNCEWIEKDNGFLIKGKDNSIFLPYCGNSFFENPIPYGFYWTSTQSKIDKYQAAYFYLCHDFQEIRLTYRWSGFSIRPVANEIH